MKRKQMLRMLLIIGLMAPVFIRAEESPSPVSPKRHHKHKKHSHPAPSPTPAAAVSGTPSNAPINPGVIGNVDPANQDGARSPGAPNMGSGDHVPGTTGTSGQ